MEQGRNDRLVLTTDVTANSQEGVEQVSNILPVAEGISAKPTKLREDDSPRHQSIQGNEVRVAEL
jgi:hypothetical protein